MEVAYLGLGSNLGDRAESIARGLRLLAARGDIVLGARSSIRETAPVGGPPQPPYLNAVAAVRTLLSPWSLLERAREVERLCGRVREARWGPRTLDIDLLLRGDAVATSPRLELPHPRLAERRFVLEPLCDIAPGARDPRSGRTAREMLDVLADRGSRIAN